MISLENDVLRVGIRPQGAELTSLFDKTTQTERLWQADPAVWGWHAPNLFPVVGGCLENQLRIDGKTYPMERHGFARQSEFSLLHATATEARFSLRFSEKTYAVYPYRFDFQIAYALDGATLRVTYLVVNEDRQPVFFSVGAHPAFNVPFFPGEAYEDYFLEFEHDEPLTTHLLSKAGLFSGETAPVPTENRHLLLTKHLFDRDALVFKKLTSRRVTLGSRNHDHRVAVRFDAFPYLGLWAKPGAPFVCIEPWLGCADSEGQAVGIEQKEAIQRVGVGETFEASFTIHVS
jgi:galactose mutarotase-like enzyme